MAQTATSLASILKQAWTDQRLKEQYENGNVPYQRFQAAVPSTMIGLQAQVPIHSYRSFDFTSLGSAGGNLNPATAQQVTNATYSLVQGWKQIALEASAVAQATGQQIQAVVAAKDLEIEGAVESVKHNWLRQLVTNGDGIVAACATMGSASTTVPLVAAASEGQYYGYSALVRGWLGPNGAVDIGTTSDTDSLATGTTISAVSTDPVTPTITVGSSIQTTQGTHFVYIPNPNSTTAANPELNGLRLITNTTGALGGLNPSTAGQDFWKGAYRDSSTTILSLDLMLNMQRSIRQNTGGTEQTDVWTSFKQETNFYSLLQNQARFGGDGNLAAGDVGAPKWNNMKLQAFSDVLDTDMFFLTLSDLVRVVSGFGDSPRWASDLQGANQGMLWSQGTTQFGDGLLQFLQVGAKRRNTQAAAIALQA